MEYQVTTADVQHPQATAHVTTDILALADRYGFGAVRPEEFPDVHVMASRLMNHPVSSCETFRAVQAVQAGSSLCFREDGVITGIMGVLLLRKPAVAQLKSGRFDGKDVDIELLSRGAERPAIGYGWGIAATTKAAGAAITALGMPLRLGPLGALTFITKAVTGAGRHVAITRFGYQPLRHADDDLLISAPVAERLAA